MYSPKINYAQVRKLYFLKMSYATIGINKAMTEIVKDALDKYIPVMTDEILQAGGTILMPEELKGKKEAV